jgi:NADH-quinone oxidoreductase subunit L
MDVLILLLILIPFAGFALSMLLPKKHEKLISLFSVFVVSVHGLSLIGFIVLWIMNGSKTIEVTAATLFKSEHFNFFVCYNFDKIALVFAFAGSFLTFIVTIYSRFYLHRENGYKRFFTTIMLFYVGYNTAVMSGNLETLFIGWEILGVSSFLLIAFYRERFLPVRNAMKVFSVYRIGDIALLLAIWMTHHLWHENITFLQLSNEELVLEHIKGHYFIAAFISFCFLIAALIKSAQFPFSSWLPRAMEGPTPSSAIFYGSLSVHLGAFLLLRTFPFWEQIISIRVLVIVLGIVTAIVATSISRVQSTIKSQIAYASIAQIGFIFIEIAAGFTNIALIHFTANALFRTYQLLVSPSVVSYLLRKQFYSPIPERKTIEDSLPKRIEYTMYMWSMKEWNLDNFMGTYVWGRIERIGKFFSFLPPFFTIYASLIAFVFGIIAIAGEFVLPSQVRESLPIVCVVISLIFVIRSFREKKKARGAWLLILFSHFWIAMAISFNGHIAISHLLVYLGGLSVFAIIGFLCMLYLKSKEKSADLIKYYGHVFEYPKLAFVFFISCLGLAAFPISPSFIGEDLLLSYIHGDQIVLAILTCISFMIGGLSLIRIYSKLFLGPHTKTYHQIAYKSS